MRFRMYVSHEAAAALEYEQPSTSLRTFLTRRLRKKISAELVPDDGAVLLTRMNRLINQARTLIELPIYVLEADDWGDYSAADHAWHNGEFELLLRRMDTVQFVEFLGELIEDKLLGLKWLNARLAEDGLSFEFVTKDDKLGVHVLPMEQLEELSKAQSQWHENIRMLIHRMESSDQSHDYAAVIHSGASIFETLAKEVVGLQTVQNQTLKSFFGRYRKDSSLPDPVLDHIEALYDRRNVTPLAGHGSLAPPPTLSEKESRTLIEMTKAFVAIEYQLKLSSAKVAPPTPTGPRSGTGHQAVASLVSATPVPAPSPPVVPGVALVAPAVPAAPVGSVIAPSSSS